MKIVDVNEFYAEQGGGVRTYVDAKFRAAAAHGHDLTVIAPGPTSRVEPREGGRVAWVKGPPLPPDPRYYLLYREAAVHALIDAEAPDIVEGSSVWTSGWFAGRYQASSRARAPAKVLFYHQDAIAVYPHTLLDRIVPRDHIDRACSPLWAALRRLSSHYDRTIVGGPSLAERLVAHGVRRPVSIPLGVDKTVFSPEHRSEALRRELLARCGLPESARLLVAVSRHHPEKRIGTLLRAVEKASPVMPLGLLLFGDGPLRRWVAQRARKLPHVRVEGFRKDREELARVLASADAFLHGSAAETYGLVVAEAIASGTPVVVPNVGGAMDLAADEHAETYPPGDASACADAIVRILRRDRVTLRQACAHYRDQSLGTLRDHFAQLFRLYETLTRPAEGKSAGAQSVRA